MTDISRRTPLKLLVKVLLILHLFFFPIVLLLWGQGYVGLTRHLHEGVVHEIKSLLLVGPFCWYPRFAWGGISPGGLYNVTEILNVTMTPDEGVAEGLHIIWGERLEERLREIQPPEVFNSLVWTDRVERTGNREPTLIASGTAEVEREWLLLESPFTPPFSEGAIISQRVYNFDRLWLIFHSIMDYTGRPVAPYSPPPVIPAITIEGMWGIHSPLNSPADVLEQIRAYRPGFMPVDYRLRVAVMPKPIELWFLPVRRGALEGIFGIIVFGLSYILTIATAPYRMFFYLPLVFVPRILVWPVAVLWAMMWLAGWIWCFVAYRRMR